MLDNPLLIVILIILISHYIFSRVLSYLNARNWSDQLPKELEGIYDAEKYRKSQEYDKIKQKFSFYTSTFSLLIMLIMLISGGFAYVDAWIGNYTANPVLRALGFFGILFIASDILSLPFSIYDTFVIEEKFGFNKTSVKTFIIDKLKSYLLGAIIGGGLLALFVWLHELIGQSFWIFAWIAFSLFMILLVMFYSSLILPLFNKLTPLPQGELRSAIEAYCKKVNFKLQDLFIMDGSKRSSKANAFFSGLGKKKRIVLYDTLVNNHTTDELVAVLAHEIGHYKKKHSRTGMIFSIFQMGLMLYILSWFIKSPDLSEALGASEPSLQLSLIAFGLLFTPLSLLISIVINIFLRKNEYEADEYAALTFNGSALGDALKKLSVHNLSNLNPHPAYVFVYYSHPTMLDRLEALKKISNNY